MDKRKPRERYQNGSLTIEKRKTGPAVWVFRWRESNSIGAGTKRKRIIGTKEELPTRKAALQKVDALSLKINDTTASPNVVSSFRQLAEHFCTEELTRKDARTELTCKVYLHHCRRSSCLDGRMPAGGHQAGYG